MTDDDKPAVPIACLACNTRVTFAELALLEELKPGYWHVVWSCACGIREHSGALRVDVIDGLLDGYTPELPYTAVPLPAAQLRGTYEGVIAALGASLLGVQDVGDFLTQCDHDDKRLVGGDVLTFGTHKGKTVAEAYALEPEYVEWAAEHAQEPVRSQCRKYLESQHHGD